MVRIAEAGEWDSVDACVEAFEEAQADGRLADPADFLPPPGHARYLDALGELLRVDLEYGWRRGRRPSLEEYRGRFPALFADLDHLAGVAFEEYRLRREAGETVLPAEYRWRFGVVVDHWPVGSTDGGLGNGCHAPPAPEASALVEVLRNSVPAASRRLDRALNALPATGSAFLGFQLEAILGSGAFGRVYLARQGDLAGRPVALKISANVAGESRVLAQLQHTNVVPIYSVHRAGELQAVCMPYFGATTLADVVRAIGRRDGLPDSGADVVSAIEERRSDLAGAVTTAGNDRRADAEAEQLAQLRSLSYVRAILALAARIADGLAHAHGRGVLHRDLKPANILLADDGEPMLLDFNLATDAQLCIRASAALVGGTLPYMAPEQLGAFAGRPADVGAAADVYAMGLILFELLTGHHPFEVRRGPLADVLTAMIDDRRVAPPDPRRLNRAVSPALAAIVRRCLEFDAARRYGDARPLHEDLRRQLADLPLKHVREPSLVERLAKWARRHPGLTSSTSIGVLGLALTGGLAGALVVRQRQVESLAAAEALHGLAEDRIDVEVLLGTRDAPPSQVAEGTAIVARVLAKYGDSASPGWAASPLAARMGERDRARLREDLGEVLYLAARNALWRGPLEEARALCHRAATAYGSGHEPRALWYLSAEIARRSGDEREAQRSEEHGRDAPVESHRDRLMLAADRLDRGQFGEALPYVLDAARREPQDVGTWTLLGNGYASLGRLDEARHAFDMALSLRPDLGWLHFNRGLLALERRDFRGAVADFDGVLGARPDDPAALVNRALARLGLGDARGAVADLDAALSRPGTPARALFIRARAKASFGDAQGAARDREAGLAREPDDVASWVARGLARLPAAPKGAIADFEAALRLDPTSYDALQNKAAVLSESLGQPDEAVRVLDRAIDLHPSRVRARDGRGILLARLGRRDAALRDAEAALALDPAPETLYRVAGIYAMTSRQQASDRGQALRLLAAAIGRDPSWLAIVPTDSDLLPIRTQPEFVALVDVLARIVHIGP
jgi:serine/threonine protein kinase/Tfp pilus assembly protein PilF